MWCVLMEMDCGIFEGYLVAGADLNKEQLNRIWQSTKDDTLFF